MTAGRITWLATFLPPSGNVIRIVAVTLPDEHVFNQEGGRGRGKPARGSGGYSLDPPGQPHRAMVGTKTKSLVIYTGEPEEIR